MAKTTQQETTQQATKRSTSKLRTLASQREFGVLIAFLSLCGVIAVTRPDLFFDPNGITSIFSRLLRQVAVTVIIGIGMTFLIISGEFDLSVGSMFALGGVLLAMFVNDFGIAIPLSFGLVLLAGGLAGVTNGVIVTKVGIPSLITTIGMMSVLRGLALYFTPGGTRSIDGESLLLDLLGAQHEIFGVIISNQAIWMLMLIMAFGIVLQQTKFGYRVRATGDNEDAAEKTGIDTDRIKIASFVITGALAAFAGMTSIAYFNTIYGTTGQQTVLLVIAAVILGGTNLFGGEGTLTGTLVGSLAIGIIPIVLIFNSIPVEIKELLTGAVIIGTLVVDVLVRRKS